MDNSNLNNSLNELHQELSKPQPTPKTQAVADELRAQIEPILEKPGTDLSAHHQTLGERLNLALVDLDVDHPRLSKAIQTVLEDLAAVGI